MALTQEFVEAHIATWENNLRNVYRPYREKWPSRLFHHAPLENAVGILQDGNLRSRLDPRNNRVRDVAAAGVIDNRQHAHNAVRFYFRPRTPTQWNIEGIRKTGECRYGDDSHAPILVMFVFDARSLLTLEGTQFCDRNMQLANAVPSDAEDYFSAIPFDKVYHEGGIGGDRSIIDHRCAEVLAPTPVLLADTLQWVYCRSEAERDTLLYQLGASARKWSKKILISDDLLVFERKFVFLENVSLGQDGLTFQLNPRSDRKTVAIQVNAWDANGKEVIAFQNDNFSPLPEPPAKKWRVGAKLRGGTYLVEIKLEEHLAFRAKISLGGDLV